MRVPNPTRFLTYAALGIAAVTVAAGPFTAEKNAGQLDLEAVHAAASVMAVTDSREAIGKCVPKGRSDIIALIGGDLKIHANTKNDLGALLGNTGYEILDAISTAIKDGKLALTNIEPSREYEFTVKDGEPEFWECVLSSSGLFSNVTLVGEGFFDTGSLLSTTPTFEQEVQRFGYSPGAVSRVPYFLDLINLPPNNSISKRTVYLRNQPFIRVFELGDSPSLDYYSLKEAIREQAGPVWAAAFGTKSYYITWDDMAATILPIGGKIFGFSYYQDHFKHTRRVISVLQENLK
ncbi:MAG: hypothetical protein ABIH35_00850 [Patescibacteria group bacterium]